MPRFRTLYGFSGYDDGSAPYASLAIGSDSVLYGTTVYGGTTGNGTVFSLAPPASAGAAWTHRVLYSFAGGLGDGSGPQAGVVIGAGGVLYGTTLYGGSSNDGMVFSLVPPASPGGAWSESVLYSFKGGADGANPVGLTIGPGGILYGATEFGGSANGGIVFSLTPLVSAPGALTWNESVLHAFVFSDGSTPTAGVVIGSVSERTVLYGTTNIGGPEDLGTVYSLTQPASSSDTWTLAVLHNFTTNGDGEYPTAGLVIGNDGVLYGTTFEGGTYGYGTAFSLTPDLSVGSWNERLIYSFEASQASPTDW